MPTFVPARCGQDEVRRLTTTRRGRPPCRPDMGATPVSGMPVAVVPDHGGRGTENDNRS
jgi:hypothetical protein